jgi:hypothetical protein
MSHEAPSSLLEDIVTFIAMIVVTASIFAMLTGAVWIIIRAIKLVP